MLTFTNVVNLTIIGQGSASTQLTCNKSKSASMVFSRSRNIIIRNLSIDGCGAGIGENITAVLFQNCTHVTVAGVLISNSVGEGLTLANTAGRVLINSSRFMHQSKSNLTCHRGLQILHDYSDIQEHVVKYTFIRCTFHTI